MPVLECHRAFCNLDASSSQEGRNILMDCMAAHFPSNLVYSFNSNFSKQHHLCWPWRSLALYNCISNPPRHKGDCRGQTGETFGDSPAQLQGSDTGWGCLQTSQGPSAVKSLGLKVTGCFLPYKENNFTGLLWDVFGQNGSSTSTGWLKPFGGIWSLSAPEDLYIVGSLITAREGTRVVFGRPFEKARKRFLWGSFPYGNGLRWLESLPQLHERASAFISGLAS